MCLFDYSGNYDFSYDMKKGLRPRKSVRSAMQHEVMFYALAQKEGCVLLLPSNTIPCT